VCRLREAGYRVAIDDISPAVANHEALMAMPFTTMKLDRTIVARGATDAAAAAFVERTIASAKARGLVVIAEGIADRKTWNRMRRAGADLAQGFFIARPLPLQAVPAWMAAWGRAPARRNLHT
jgi:EAL domain-containing protein (putative c-di-GMP-specific phosphodiesterase class I)